MKNAVTFNQSTTTEQRNSNIAMYHNGLMPLPNEQYYALMQNYFDSAIRVEREKIHYENEANLAILKSELKVKQQLGMENRKQQRENAYIEVVELSDGEMVSLTHFPNGEVQTGPCLLNVRHLRMKRLGAKLSFGLLVSNDFTTPLVLSGKDFCPEGLKKVLANAGVAINVSKKKRSEYAEYIFDYLLRNAELNHIPQKQGWNSDDDEWFFAADYYETLDALMEDD